MHGDAADRGDDRGRDADRPVEIQARDWRGVARRVWQRSRDDNLTLIAAGVAFFALLSFVPAVAASVAAYGLVREPEDIARQVDELGGPIPDEARRLLSEQLSELASAGSARLGIGLIVGLAVSLWGASAAMGHLMVAVTAAYGEHEDRGFVRRRAVALAMTVAGIAFFVVVIAVLTGLPAWVGAIAGSPGRTVALVVRWPLLAAVMLLALAVVYRVGPHRDEPRWRWLSGGAVVAVVVWLLASAGFSLYASSFGTYNETYGALGGVVVFMLWLFITVGCVLLGAEVNAELERQTARDSTGESEQSISRRGSGSAGEAAGEV